MSANAERAWPTAHDDERCRTFVPLLELVGRRWVGLIILAGMRGAERFGQYRAMVGGISDSVLSQRLKELTRCGLMNRTVVPTTPVTVRYRPTADGVALVAALQPLIDFANRTRLFDAAPADCSTGG
ncbi:winged helix-turn-helix transcriptional regulator [Saccharothrix coeruleofusca]|uniref:winged helix-turn-helix transcriptional regulator n=1 Tax=Saccharothrix coeruleofusca TaxID=33919 RepID=UPI001AE9DA84|nr:helix-turn-helix domain-containing protein [Saccharothrix coeruleofusca]MBP2337188.1 DNA-binding HxlR family transcriptional regulator [Saccharothrix coeruleofusca]